MFTRTTRSQTAAALLASSASSAVSAASAASASASVSRARAATSVKITRPLRTRATATKGSVILAASTTRNFSTSKISKDGGAAYSSTGDLGKGIGSSSTVASKGKPEYWRWGWKRKESNTDASTAKAPSKKASTKKGPAEKKKEPTKRKPKAKTAADNGIIPISPPTPPTYITSTTLRVGLDYIKTVEPRLEPWIEIYDFSKFDTTVSPTTINPFKALLRGIISQQISGIAAQSILKKFLAIFNPDAAEPEGLSIDGLSYPTPAQLRAVPFETLRTAGVSERKAKYMHSLADHFLTDPLLSQNNHESLFTLPEAEIIQNLTAINGIGAWSAEMFLIFELHRGDIFSVGDLGIQRGMATFLGRDVTKPITEKGKWKFMTEEEMIEMSNRFAPYRTLFSLLMWKVSDTVKEVEKEVMAKGKHAMEIEQETMKEETQN